MIKLADTLAPMADFPAVEAKDVAFSDNKTLQEKYDNGELGGAGTSVTVDTEMSDTSENTVQNKVIKKYVDNNLTDVQTELTNIKKELSDGMTLVADAITAKGVETATDATLEVMAANIGAIKVGDDTSDATATESDIMLGKTAWANGVKLVGTASSSELHGATISVSSKNEGLVGCVVTLIKDEMVVGTRTLDENMTCSFTGIQEIGEYVVSISDGTLTNKENVTITGDNIVNKTVIAIVFYATTKLNAWLNSGGVAESFSTLDEVFASEVTVRRLMTVHVSVDLLKNWMLADPSIVDTFVANSVAMKWMGLRDYAYDTLTSAVDGLEEKILASDNWEYALKDHVPIMTSDTAPYGEAITNSITSGYNAYKAFNGVSATHTSDRWASAQNALSSNNVYIGYKFTNPICVKRMMVKTRCDSQTDVSVDTTQDYELFLEGSNDGDSWDSIQTISMKADDSYVKVHTDINNDGYYTYYRCRFTTYNSLNSVNGWCNIAELQFYGRSLNVSVPTMTSNTAPWGEVYNNDSSTAQQGKPYLAFDKTPASNNVSNYWWQEGADGILTYKFSNKVCVKYLMLRESNTYSINRGDSYPSTTFTVYGSSDGNSLVPIETFNFIGDTPTEKHKDTYFVLNNSNSYQYYHFKINGYNNVTSGNVKWCVLDELQYYGVDYSEREFAEGSTMKYIYDHGVELEEVTLIDTNESEKRDSYVYLKDNSSSASGGIKIAEIDMTPYNLIRVNQGGDDVVSINTGNRVGLLNPAESSWNAYRAIVASDLPYSSFCDISSVNANAKPVIIPNTVSGVGGSLVITEWWLE